MWLHPRNSCLGRAVCMRVWGDDHACWHLPQRQGAYWGAEEWPITLEGFPEVFFMLFILSWPLFSPPLLGTSLSSPLSSFHHSNSPLHSSPPCSHLTLFLTSWSPHQICSSSSPSTDLWVCAHLLFPTLLLSLGVSPLPPASPSLSVSISPLILSLSFLFWRIRRVCALAV